jgi:hypothetical protein
VFFVLEFLAIALKYPTTNNDFQLSINIQNPKSRLYRQLQRSLLARLWRVG